jgi:hypothetical protein
MSKPPRQPAPQPAVKEGGEHGVDDSAPPPAAPGMIREGEAEPRERPRDGGMIGEG